MDSLNRLLEDTSRCLCRYESLIAGRPILAAISGGIDSTVLALVLARLRAENRLPGPLRFCHIDHATRGDSRQNAEHVTDLADHLDVPIHVRRLEDLAEAHAGDQLVSEDTLRRARYEAIGVIAKAYGARAIATAHHADDNIETVLFRMMRGTGPRGLAGIPEARWLSHADQRLLVVRPLLQTRRKILEAFLNELGYQAFHDRSNDDLRYARNRLRHETIPQLRNELGAGLDMTIMTLANTARASSELVEANGLRILSTRGERRSPWMLHLDLRETGEADRPFVQEALRQAHGELHPRNEWPLQNWLKRAMDLLEKDDGSRLMGRGGLLVERTRKGLLLVNPAEAGPAPGTEHDSQLLHFDAGRQQFGGTEYHVEAFEYPQPPLVPPPTESGPWRALIDPRNAPEPWRLRTRRPGDQFQPLGSATPVTLRRFLQSRHVPRFDRDRLPLLVDARDRILWVPGVEVSEMAKLQLNTGRTVELRVTTS
ncbi:MAG: tRNA lysidine(34) synthetase TilS [Planctomycetota bacterium]|nr:tRNA lysidine(34) synthetase TilS [Planctomycetota bacterium]